MLFNLQSSYKLTDGQSAATDKLAELIDSGNRHQTLLGVTGSGKTFVTANVIAKINKPTLVIAHNKTLAAQLYQEYRDFFPENAVSYFVSYYDYYQPEAYIPQTDTYIEKETDINEMIDKLRLKTTANLVSRRDVIVVSSVSCIYNLGEPQEYLKRVLKLNLNQKITLRELSEKLVDLMYQRSQMELARSGFRIRGDSLDIWPAYEDSVLRIEIEANTIKSFCWLDPIFLSPNPKLTRLQTPDASATGGQATNNQQQITIAIFPAKHYIADSKDIKLVFSQIRNELHLRVKQLEAEGRELEAKRLIQKVEYDLAMIQELGYVNGIENYSRYFDRRNPGEPPFTLLDYFKQCDPDFLTVVDESHITLPQIKGMFKGDQSRKQTLIDFGFRLPAALDNRPLQYDEFLGRVNQVIYTSATPGEQEMEMSKKSVIGSRLSVISSKSFGHQLTGSKQKDRRQINSKPKTENRKLITDNGVVELLVRPTGLIDPEIEVRNAKNQVPDLVVEILKRKAKNERILVTTLTKKTAEALAEYLVDEKKINHVVNSQASDVIPAEAGIYLNRFRVKPGMTLELPKVAYLHSDVKTLDRQDTLDKLRRGEVDVIVGINLLREGLDLPEVSLVAILDADMEGFLRSKTSLIQTMGRAARHIDGKVILYAYKVTDSMKEAIAESERRRKVQIEYNLKHNIFPTGISKPVREKLVDRSQESVTDMDLPKGISNRYGVEKLDDLDFGSLSPQDKQTMVKHLRKQMLSAADNLNFEKAAKIRDKINEIKEG